MTQGQLAARAGITQSAVSQIESGVRPNPNLMTLHLLEKALGDPPVRLAYLDGPPMGFVSEALTEFLTTPVAAELKLTPQEIDELRQWSWYAEHETPSEQAWADFVRVRRRVRHDSAPPRR